MGEKFELIAKTFQGLEEVLAKELVKLGAEEVEVLRRGVSFKGDQEMMYKANFCCRTAVRIIKPVLKFTAEDADEVYEKVKAFEWEKYLDKTKTFAIDAVVYSEIFRHSQFLSYRVKDAIADRFMEKNGWRPSVRLTNPDLKINVHVSHNEVTLSFDSSGEPLYRRGYRTDQTEAPLNEVLAAGLLLLAGWDGQQDLIDPMCGSGTFLTEAALIARNIAPGIYRKSFDFEKWPDFDADLLQKLFEDDSQEREFTHTIYGSDILKQAIAIAEDNVRSAGVSKFVDLKVCPIQELEVPSNDALVIFNPPYGKRIKVDDLSQLYAEIGSKLKKDFTGMSAWLIIEPNEATQNIGLAPSKHIAVDNGGIPCEFRKYEMFQGRRDDFLRERAENATPAAEGETAETAAVPETKKEEEPAENPGYTFHVYDYKDPAAIETEEDSKEDGKDDRRGGFRREGGSDHFRGGDRDSRGGDRGPRRSFGNDRGGDRPYGDRGRSFGDRDKRGGFRKDNDRNNDQPYDETDGFKFDTPEEREAYIESKRRHEKFKAFHPDRREEGHREEGNFHNDRGGDRFRHDDRDNRGGGNYHHDDDRRGSYGNRFGRDDRDRHSDNNYRSDRRDDRRDSRGGSSYGHSSYQHREGGYPQDRINGGHSVERHGERSWSRDGFNTREDRGGERPRRHDFRDDGYKPKRNFDRRKGDGNKGNNNDNQ